MTAPRKSASGIRRPASGIAIDIRRLIRLRHQRSWSRADLAAAAGLSVSMIGKIENRERQPGTGTLRSICAALGCDISELLLLREVRKSE
jgi:transcriptional regulator with XRE-family HTH domain